MSASNSRGLSSWLLLKDGQGIILPIDGVVVECDDALAAQVEALLSAAAAD